jgi:hypothetical protein
MVEVSPELAGESDNTFGVEMGELPISEDEPQAGNLGRHEPLQQGNLPVLAVGLVQPFGLLLHPLSGLVLQELPLAAGQNHHSGLAQILMGHSVGQHVSHEGSLVETDHRPHKIVVLEGEWFCCLLSQGGDYN